MASKEDYLLRLEDNMISRLSDNYESLNKNLIFLYTVLFFLLLLEFGLIKDISIEGTTLVLSDYQRLIVIPMLVMLPYLLINNSMLNIARIIGLLKKNANEVLVINPEARPFSIHDLDIYSSGVAGIQYQLSQYIVDRHLNPEMLNISFSLPDNRRLLTMIFFTLNLPLTMFMWFQRLNGQIIKAIIYIFLLVILYVLPLVITLSILYNKSISSDLKDLTFTKFLSGHIIVGLYLLLIMGYTLWVNWKLYMVYSIELNKLKTVVSHQSRVGLIRGIKQIYRYYIPA